MASEAMAPRECSLPMLARSRISSPQNATIPVAAVCRIAAQWRAKVAAVGLDQRLPALMREACGHAA